MKIYLFRSDTLTGRDGSIHLIETLVIVLRLTGIVTQLILKFAKIFKTL